MPVVKRRTAAVTPVAWVVTGEIDLADWVVAGRKLGAMSRCSQWWLGDWIRYGNARFGERYARATSITGYDAQSLMNMVWVASRFEISRRRENLSWSHHETVASLDHQEQDQWLDLAVDQRLTVSDLRVELRSALRHREDRAQPQRRDDYPQGSGVVICPNCGHAIPPKPERSKAGETPPSQPPRVWPDPLKSVRPV